MVQDFIKGLIKEGWKQKEIAEKCGVVPQCINGIIKNGSCSLETAIKIADAFGVSLDAVTGRKPAERIMSATQELLIEMTSGDDEVARAALRCAEGEKLIKAKEGEGRRVKAA